MIILYRPIVFTCTGRLHVIVGIGPRPFSSFG